MTDGWWTQSKGSLHVCDYFILGTSSVSLCFCPVSRTCGWVPPSNQFCWSLLGELWNMSLIPASVSDGFPGIFSPIHLPHCMTVMSWLDSLIGQACSPAVLEWYNWTAGFKGNMKLVVTHLWLLCYYIFYSPPIVSIDPKFQEIRPKKPIMCVSIR